VRSKVITTGGPHRTFRVGVWIGRTVGWLLLFVAIFGGLQSEFSNGTISAFRTFPSVALGLVAAVWIVAIEVFLRFFDRYMSRN
jgi:hypothetical protein